MLRRRYQLLLLAAIILCVFYPTVFGELNSIDDVEMTTSLLNLDHWSFRELFFPRSTGGLYYRPLLYLTFLLDNDLWGMQPSFLHLENILFHLGNVLLIFQLARLLLPKDRRDVSYLPLTAALLFGLHPLVTEPVDWISGRTDVLAANFVLLSAVLLLAWKEKKGGFLMVASLGALALGMMTKEVAIAFVPGFLIFLLAKSPGAVSSGLAFHPRAGTRKAVFVLGFLLCGTGAFYLVRAAAFATNSSKIALTFRFMANDPIYTAYSFLRVFAFYIRKIYWPFPQSFGILEIDPLYDLLGLLLVIALFIVICRGTVASATFLAGAAMLAPSFPVAFGQIAWTPYAERYIYIATAFIVTGTVFLLRNLLERHRGLPVKAGVVCLVAAAGLATFERNLIWKTNLSLYQDTVRKSPDFSKAWNELGVAYCNLNDLKNAEISFIRASALYSMEYDPISDMNLAAIFTMEGREDDAGKMYKKVAERSHWKSRKALEKYLSYLASKESSTSDQAELESLKREEIHYSEKLFDLSKSPYLLCRIVKVAQEIGDTELSLQYYRRAYELLPAGNLRRDFARRNADKIGRE